MSEPTPVRDTPPSDLERAKAQARADLDDILALKHSAPMTRYFFRRLRAKIEPVEHEILNSKADRTEKHTHGLLVHRETLLSILSMLEDDEQGNRSILGI